MATPATITTLNRLIRTCRDAEWLSRAWSRAADSPHLRTRFRTRSEEWARLGDELQALVLLLGGEPANAATVTARAQAAWLACRSTVMGKSDERAVDGCERVQQHALGCYEQALSGYLPERIRRTVSLQGARVYARCDRLLEPRAQFAAP
jgi:uncharacterized protein (TIGR02284 family)